MTAADLASPRVAASIEQIEAHSAGPRRHPVPRGLWVWHGAMLTEAYTCCLPLLRAMIDDEVPAHGGVTVV